MTFYDADRLDLGRVGIIPDPRRLCTDAAKKIRRFRGGLQAIDGGLVMSVIWKVRTVMFLGALIYLQLAAPYIPNVLELLGL